MKKEVWIIEYRDRNFGWSKFDHKIYRSKQEAEQGIREGALEFIEKIKELYISFANEFYNELTRMWCFKNGNILNIFKIFDKINMYKPDLNHDFNILGEKLRIIRIR